MHSPKNSAYVGITLALLAVIIWSGNFVISRGVSTQIGPVSLAFYRWTTATLIIAPLAWKQFKAEKAIVRQQIGYLFCVSLSGIALFNTFVYVAGHYTSAINLALIGPTSSPLFATSLAVLFLREKPGILRIAGLLTCFAGILVLLSNGSLQTLAGFRFSTGDLWVLAGAMAFAVYNVLVRRKHPGISALNFLFVVFAMGALMLLPAYLCEWKWGMPTHWSPSLLCVILYLGAGTSVTAFLCWNKAIHLLGAGRTVVFGNLIPLLSTLEAVWLLHETITTVHLVGGMIVIAGLVLANTKQPSIPK